MKKTIIIMLSSVLSINAIAQEKTNPELYLSNYSFNTVSEGIANFKVAGNNVSLKKVRIIGDVSKYLKLGRNFSLSLRTNITDPEIRFLDVPVEAETSAGLLRDTFRLVKDDFIRNKVIAHRGAWKNTGVTENSIGALQHAVRLGCQGSEFDVHMSSDSVLFVHHDHDINGVNIEQTASATLSAIKLPDGESLPTVEGYLREGLRQNKTKLILEIKPSKVSKERSLALTRKVVALVKDMKAEGWVDYISFDYDVCKELMRLAPYAKVSYLNGDKAPAVLAKEGFYGLDYHYSVLKKQTGWIKEAKENKLTVNVWTVNDQAVMDWLLKEDVEFITTNEPELLLKLIK